MIFILSKYQYRKYLNLIHVKVKTSIYNPIYVCPSLTRYSGQRTPETQCDASLSQSLQSHTTDEASPSSLACRPVSSRYQTHCNCYSNIKEEGEGFASVSPLSPCSDVVRCEVCQPCVVIHPLASSDNNPDLVGNYR